jgi:hypothetical protein
LKNLLTTRRWLVIATAAAVATPVLAMDPERRVAVTFDASASRSFEDEIVEYEAVSYVVSLRKDQTLHVVLATNNASSCFDIYAPNVAKPVFVGAESGSTHDLVAQSAGEYVVKVFLLRLAARDGQSARYTLELKLAR